MAGNPNLIGGGRLTRAETSGDKRRFEGKKLDMGALLLRLWRYIGRNKILVILAVLLNISSSLLALYGPKLSGRAINASSPVRGRWTSIRCSGALCSWRSVMCWQRA